VARPRVQDVLNVAGTIQYPLDAGKGVVVRRLRLRDRFAARWLAGSLDRELARGVAPASRESLAVRARCPRRAPIPRGTSAGAT
jgi:hypothetical protein